VHAAGIDRIAGIAGTGGSSRPPIGVFVLSSTPAREPARLPEATPRTSSRLRRVASSISIRWPGRQAASESIRAIALGSFSSR
jgi:hypothetical protein